MTLLFLVIFFSILATGSLAVFLMTGDKPPANWPFEVGD